MKATTSNGTIGLSNEAQQIVDSCNQSNIGYNKVKMHSTPLTETEIINVLSGGDQTAGSCASLGLAYIGQKGGMDVLDFRGGNSQSFFSSSSNIQNIIKLANANPIYHTAKTEVTAANQLLKKAVTGKQYYFVAGKHAAIVQKTTKGVYQYLELQSDTTSGWTDFDKSVRTTFIRRFGCATSNPYRRLYGVSLPEVAYMVDVDELKGSSDLQAILGYINTDEKDQKKGASGHVK